MDNFQEGGKKEKKEKAEKKEQPKKKEPEPAPADDFEEKPKESKDPFDSLPKG